MFRFCTVFATAFISWGGADDLDKFVALIGSFACIPLVYMYPVSNTAHWTKRTPRTDTNFFLATPTHESLRNNKTCQGSGYCTLCLWTCGHGVHHHIDNPKLGHKIVSRRSGVTEYKLKLVKFLSIGQSGGGCWGRSGFFLPPGSGPINKSEWISGAGTKWIYESRGSCGHGMTAESDSFEFFSYFFIASLMCFLFCFLFFFCYIFFWSQSCLQYTDRYHILYAFLSFVFVFVVGCFSSVYFPLGSPWTSMDIPSTSIHLKIRVFSFFFLLFMWILELFCTVLRDILHRQVHSNDD